MPNRNVNQDHIVILDLETTGLDLVHDRILEIGMLVVDIERLIVRDSFNRVLVPSLDWYERLCLSPEAFEMHAANGLTEAVEEKGVSVEEAFHDAHLFLNKFSSGKEPQPFLLSGSCVACFDLPLLKVQYPEFAARFFYRPLDASIAKAWFDLYGEGVDMPRDDSTHRALDDCYSSLEIMRNVRSKL